MTPLTTNPLPPHPGAVDTTVPLIGATFVVIDLETTGFAPGSCAITEVGAVKYRGGECEGTLATLIDPDTPIPGPVTDLTGISDTMVTGAPCISAVIPSLLEFIRGAVLVGHNVRFDRSFLDHACTTTGYEGLDAQEVDTLALARALVSDEVPNLRLSTLAKHFRTLNRPRHRALDDALATADVFHALLERVATFGVLSLGALLEFPDGLAA